MKKLSIVLSLIFLFFSGTAYANYGNSPIHWGFKKAKDEVPAEAGKPLDALLERHGSYYKGDTSKKDIYLTFDNGYENGYTGQILDVLKKENVPAAFFVTGHYLKSAPDLVKRMAAEGHIIGNHSWHHPDMTRVSDEKFIKELEMVRAETENLTGIKQMAYLRPPRGIFSERTLALAKKEGYTHVFWSLAFVDWNTDRQKGWQYSYDNIMRQIHPGCILLLHTVSKDNADALEKAIQDLKKRGYNFKSLDDLTWEQALEERMLY
ncbi:delta-lactam-biosynthetic de-N-acetylase [Cytobacillus sp. NCCP-133]|uniref:delta-lactam-biosynthetic de-N-acetylase n=1 Tax=Cytobacillus sp. NCCP-133 TaxID=766848 RepID=UPI00222E6772|nr:delta-lactam-biosynthetic de-N-acetylase [Cytobacillus sp. NCCP-133]GLB59912.1 delta-lactam-biosynthetic de-N-acetylase [Cytobacillus sp. NCCP-133]